MDALVPDFIEALREQINLANSLSTAGTAAVLFVWLRTFSIIDHEDFRGFRYSIALALPMALFLVAIILGYVITATITGYRYELLLGQDLSNDVAIDDPKVYFAASYLNFLNITGMVQLASGILGIITLVMWFGWNIIRNASMKGKGKK